MILIPLLGKTTIVTATEKELLVCYGKIAPTSIKGYKIVVLETAHYTPQEIAVFKKNNHTVLGYISLTEVNKTASFYAKLEPFLIGKNTTWNSGIIDLSKKEAQLILCNVMENIALKGVDGFFLDNIDNVSKWGKLAGKEAQLVQFLTKIKLNHPNWYLMQNSGLFLAEELNKLTDAILIESVITAYNFKSEAYGLRSEKEKKLRQSEIKTIKKSIKKPLYILEYANTKKLKDSVEKQLKKLKHPYFIANINLQTLPTFKE